MSNINMTERLRDNLGYLSDEFEEQSSSNHLRSVSPNASSNDTMKPSRQKSKSPLRSHKSTETCGNNTSSQGTVIRDSRPDIIAWPTPPNAQNSSNNHDNNQERTFEEPTKLLSIFKVASTNAPRGRESELKKKIQTLEDTVAEYERQKYNVMGTFSEYRERVAERERKLEAEYSSKIIALSEEVLGAKKDFEARMKSFQALQDKFEREKEQALEKLRQEHQKEIQVLEQRFSESQLLNLEQKYMIEIQRLEEERKSLKAEKERLGETFEMKLRRAQSLYETELTAAKMLYSKELEALRDHEEALKEELLARQDEFHDRLQELQHQTKRSREELATCRNEVTALEKRLQVKEAEVVAISKELEEARNGTNDSLRKLSQVENELQEAKQQYRQQEEELQRKSNLLNIVETAKSKLEAVIRDLQTEVKALKNKVEFLEKERENLQSQSESQAKLQSSQVNALEAVLESVTKEKEATKDHYENLLERERQQAEEREYAMKKEFSSKLNELESQYNNLKDHLGNDTQRYHEQELSNLKEENNALLVQVNTLKQELELFTRNDEDNSSTALENIKQLIDESDELKKTVEKYEILLDQKEIEIIALKQQLFEHENEISAQHLSIIKDENRYQLVKSKEFVEKEEKLANLKLTQVNAPGGSDGENATVMDENLMELKLEKDKMAESKMGTTMISNVQDKMIVGIDENTELNAMQKLTDEVTEKQQRINELEANEKRLREEFQTNLNEQVEAITLQVTCTYEKKIEQVKKEANEKNRAMAENIKVLKNDCGQKTKQITELTTKNKKLTDELNMVKIELEMKNREIMNFSKRTDEYLRKRENQQIIVLEKKIMNLNKEHEKTIEAMKKNELDLAKKYQELRQQLKTKNETCTQGIQANIDASNEMEIKKSELEVNQQIIQLQNALQEKMTLIAQLQEALADMQESEIESKKNRSHSFTAGENAKSQTNASNLQILLTENATNHRQVKTSIKCKEQHDSIKSKKKREKEDGGGDKTNHSGTTVLQLHERTFTKSYKSPMVDFTKQKDEKRNLLSTDFGPSLSSEENRRNSSGQLPLRSKKEITPSTTATSSNAKDDSRRPAWKF